MNEKFGISLVELFERVGQKDPKGLTDAFYGCEKVEKAYWFCDLFIF